MSDLLPTLDLLGRAIADDPSAADDALAQLELAVGMANALTRLADELVDRYVERARRSGESWTRIGDRLGVTKQAAQQRFG